MLDFKDGDYEVYYTVRCELWSVSEESLLPYSVSKTKPRRHLAYSSTMKTEVIRSYEMSIYFYQTARCHIHIYIETCMIFLLPFISSFVRNIHNNIPWSLLSHLGVTYKTGFGLDDQFHCISYIHKTRDYRQLQRYRWSTHSGVHRYTRARVLSLH
jgi:hypothetical protein